MTHRTRPCQAYTLIEVIAASAIIAAVLVPAFSAMSASLELSERVNHTNTMTTLCVGLLEQQLSLGAATFADLDSSGDFSSDGQPEMKYEILRSQDSSDGGVPDRLMAVHVTVWHDQDGDGLMDDEEPHMTLASKIAKLAHYQSQQ